MRVPTLATVVIALLAPMGIAEGGGGAQKPHLDVRVTPRTGFSPVEVLFTAEIVGGMDLEDYHCPQIEWNWDDGDRSVHESDCTPYQPGVEIERHFTARHLFRREGVYNVKISMLRAARPIARASARVSILSGLGDMQ